MSTDTPARATMLLRILPVVLIVLVTLVAYANSLDVPFTFDDGRNIISNSSVSGFTGDSDSMSAVLWDNPTPRPLAYLTLGINHAIGGDQVFGYHVVNTLIHALAGIAVYLLALRIARHPRVLGDAVGAERQVLFALIVALLFVSHPIQTQAVTYIVQRMASMCALFYVMSLLCYGRGRDGGDRRLWWTLGGLCWGLALASKQYAVTLPAAILLLEWFLWQDADPKFRKRMLLLGVGVAASTLAIAFVFKGQALPRLFTRGYSTRDFTMMERVMTQPRVVLHYLSLVAVPLPSRFILVYDFAVSRSFFAPPSTLLAILAITGSGVGAFLLAHRFFVASFAILWVLLHLVVESSVVPLEMVYEHRMYLPMVGICIGSAALLIRTAPNTRFAIGVAGVLTSLLVASTIARNGAWSDPTRFWSANAARAPGDQRTHCEAGRALAREGNDDRAIEMFTRGIELNPRSQGSLVSRAELMLQRGDTEAALRDADAAIALDLPRKRMTTYYPIAHSVRGEVMIRMGRYQDAVDEFTEAIRTGGEEGVVDTVWYVRLGVARASLGDMRGAVRALEQAIEITPDDWRPLNNLAFMLATSSDPAIQDGARAVELASKATELTGAELPATLGTLAAAYARAGDFQEAVRWQQACTERAEPAARAGHEARIALYRSEMPLTGP